MQEHRNFLNFLLSSTSLAEATIRRRVKIINSLNKHVDLFCKDDVVKYLNTCSWSNGTKNIAVLAYKDFRRMYGLPELKIRKYHVTQKLPFVPLETELDSLISGSSLWLSSFLRVLKETGMRPIEAWSLKRGDFDITQKTVNIRTVKRGKPRILRVSDRLLNMLGAFPKTGDIVFSVSGNPNRFSIELKHFKRNYTNVRKRLGDKLKNPRLLRISFYTFRHWKATTEYLRTRDIFHVKNMLGHSRIENTMKYVHVANAVSVEDTRFACKVAHNINEAKMLVEEGFEYVTEIDGIKLFRKPK